MITPGFAKKLHIVESFRFLLSIHALVIRHGVLFYIIWTTQHLGISARKTGLCMSVNAFIALLMQPFFASLPINLA